MIGLLLLSLAVLALGAVVAFGLAESPKNLKWRPELVSGGSYGFSANGLDLADELSAAGLTSRIEELQQALAAALVGAVRRQR